MNWIRTHSLAAHLIALLFYTLLAVVMTFPLALHLGDRLLATDTNALNDTYFSVWIFGWQAHQLIADPLNLFQANIFYPFANTLAFSEIILPGALLYLPLAYASNNPIFAYNLVVLATFPLNGLAMYLLALDWLARLKDKQGAALVGAGRSRRNAYFAAFLAGLIFAFCTYKLGELRHVQLLMGMFMPLTLMYLARFMRNPNWHNGFLVALFFALNALSSLYYAVFLAFAVALWLVIDAVQRRARYTRQHFVYGAAALVIAAVLVLPFLVPFFQLERQYNFSEGRDPTLFSARPYSYIAAPAGQWLYGFVTRNFYTASKGQPLFPGLVASALALAGAIRLWRRGSRAWIFPALLVVMGVVLSFGPVLVLGRTSTPALPFPLPYAALARVISPLRSLNAPARFVVVAMLGLAMLAAYGALVVLGRFPRAAWAVAVVAGALILAEYISVPLRLATVANAETISPAYTFLAQQPRGQPVVDVPMGKPTFADQDKYVAYTYHSLYHLQPLVNGYSTFLPPDYYALVKDMQAFPSARTVGRLKQWGVQWVVVHSNRYPDKTAVRNKLDKLKGIEHVQDFGDVWLYRIPVGEN